MTQNQTMGPQFSRQTLVATNMANVEAMRSLAITSLNATERLLALNLDFARSAFDVTANNAQSMAAAGWQAIINRQRADMQQATAKAAALVCGVYDISAEAQAEVADLVSARVGEVSDSMTSMLGAVAQYSPGGAESAVSMTQSAIADTCSIYDRFIKTTKQITATNLAAVGNAAAAIGVSSPAARTAKKAA